MIGLSYAVNKIYVTDDDTLQLHKSYEGHWRLHYISTYLATCKDLVWDQLKQFLIKYTQNNLPAFPLCKETNICLFF